MSVNKVILEADKIGQRFWGKVDKKGLSECWNWMGAKKPAGYGNVRVNKIYKNAHRVSWELTYGGIPTHMHVLHSCDNTGCCNPNHLMLGTRTSNRVDMIKKGRSNYGHANRRRGEDHTNCKLSDEQVSQIRKEYVPGKIKQSDTAAKYGVSQRLVSLITRMEVRVNVS